MQRWRLEYEGLPCKVRTGCAVWRKWTMYIMYILTENESIRVNEFQRQIGSISIRMLSRTVGELVEYGLVLRREFQSILPHVEYFLTDLGRALTPALGTLGRWGHQAWLANGPPMPSEYWRLMHHISNLNAR
jgi:DNA-binding HxlR family transcriptional regulator